MMAFMHASFDVDTIERWLLQSAGDTTEGWRHLVVAYSFKPNDRCAIMLITAPRRYFSEVGAIFEEEYPGRLLCLDRPLDPSQAIKMTKLHREMKQAVFRCPAFDSTDGAQRRVVRDMLTAVFPTQWYARGFLLFDICRFSTRTPSEQVALRLTLDTAMRQAVITLAAAAPTTDTDFGLIPTGDGYYVWHRRPARDADAATLVVGALTLAALAKPAWRGLGLHVRTSFVIGRAFTLPARELAPSRDARIVSTDALGPALNDAARLGSAAAIDQFLLGDFKNEHPVNPDESIRNPEGLLQAANQLVNNPNFNLRIEPNEKFKVIDKHGHSHQCWNVTGDSYFAMGDKIFPVNIGVAWDPTRELDPAEFQPR